MIYSGLGLLAVGIYGMMFFICWAVLFYLTKDNNYFFDNIFVCLFSMSIASVPVWFIGKWLNGRNPLRVREFVDGKHIIVTKPRHTIYNLQMEYWGFIFAVFSIVVLIAKKVNLF